MAIHKSSGVLHGRKNTRLLIVKDTTCMMKSSVTLILVVKSISGIAIIISTIDQVDIHSMVQVD